MRIRFLCTLEQLPELLDRIFSSTINVDATTHKETINSILYETFMSKYDRFKKNPKEFFDSLSLEILDSIARMIYTI